jgi:hypothetical protein
MMTEPAWKIDTTFTYQTFVEHDRPTPMKPFLAAALGQTAAVVTTEDACPQDRSTPEERRAATDRLEKMLADDYDARFKAS